MNQPFDLTKLAALSSEVATLTRDVQSALAAFKKAKGGRLREQPLQHSDDPANRKWREREFDYVSSYYALAEKAATLAAPLLSLAEMLQGVRKVHNRITSPLSEQIEVVEYSRIQESATALFLEFDLIEVPETVGGFNSCVYQATSAARRYSIRRSIAFLSLRPMIPALPLTLDEALQQAKGWMAATATGNVEVFELETGKVWHDDDLPAPRLPMPIAEALRLNKDDSQPKKKLYATISLVYHASSEPSGGFDGSPCCQGNKLELDYVKSRSHRLCRCGANVRLGTGSSTEEIGCCSGGTW